MIGATGFKESSMPEPTPDETPQQRDPAQPEPSRQQKPSAPSSSGRAPEAESPEHPLLDPETLMGSPMSSIPRVNKQLLYGLVFAVLIAFFGLILAFGTVEPVAYPSLPGLPRTAVPAAGVEVHIPPAFEEAPDDLPQGQAWIGPDRQRIAVQRRRLDEYPKPGGASAGLRSILFGRDLADRFDAKVVDTHPARIADRRGAQARLRLGGGRTLLAAAIADGYVVYEIRLFCEREPDVLLFRRVIGSLQIGWTAPRQPAPAGSSGASGEPAPLE
jgi:hypothetical protein